MRAFPPLMRARLRPLEAACYLWLAVGCGSAATVAPAPPPPTAPPPSSPPAAIALAGPDVPGTDACFVLGAPDGTVRRSDPGCAGIRLRPASTFKLASTLIAASVGLITSPDTVLRYDATRYPMPPDQRPEWQHDQSVRDALRVSAVPLYRLLAIKIGAERMQAHLDRLGYGNRSTSGGLDAFWLTGGLAISADEQLAFLTALLADQLPVAPAAQQLVRAATPTEPSAAATLHWKTGTGELDGGGMIGWLVGWVERADGNYPFACWVRAPDDDFEQVARLRTAVCRGTLAALQLMPAPPP